MRYLWYRPSKYRNCPDRKARKNYTDRYHYYDHVFCSTPILKPTQGLRTHIPVYVIHGAMVLVCCCGCCSCVDCRSMSSKTLKNSRWDGNPKPIILQNEGGGTHNTCALFNSYTAWTAAFECSPRAISYGSRFALSATGGSCGDLTKKSAPRTKWEQGAKWNYPYSVGPDVVRVEVF